MRDISATRARFRKIPEPVGEGLAPAALELGLHESFLPFCRGKSSPSGSPMASSTVRVLARTVSGSARSLFLLPQRDGLAAQGFQYGRIRP
jgi:hypothetical protein